LSGDSDQPTVQLDWQDTSEINRKDVYNF